MRIVGSLRPEMTLHPAIHRFAMLGRIGKPLFGIAIGALLAFTLVEGVIRSMGFVDFPLYDADGDQGYFARAGQQGRFMNINDWYFNDRGMPIARPFDETLHPNVLLVGNSVVMGGNLYRQSEKVPELLQEMFGRSPVVWPTANGGWTEMNQIRYFDRNDAIMANADYVAWEYMAGGLSKATPWAGEYAMPTRTPLCATCYVMRRYVLPVVLSAFVVNELPVTGDPTSDTIRAFDDRIGRFAGRSTHDCRKGLIWLYPTQSQLATARRHSEWLPERKTIREIADRHGLRIVDIADYPEWDEALYQPDRVHPNVAGNMVLAGILYSEIKKDLN